MGAKEEIGLLEEDLQYAEGKEKKAIENQIKQLRKRIKNAKS